MVVGTCAIELHLPGISSLKEKRSCIRPLIKRVMREFNISAAEVDLQDVWQSSTVGVAVVSNNASHAEQVIDSVLHWIERNRPDVMIVAEKIEILHI